MKVQVERESLRAQRYGWDEGTSGERESMRDQSLGGMKKQANGFDENT